MIKEVTKTNQFKRLEVDPNGRLIDATKDITEKDIVADNYRKLQSEQFDPLPNYEVKAVLIAYLASFGLLVLFLTFAYILLIHII